MSWLFSQALAAEYSAATCSGGAPSAPLSVMPTPHKFWRNDKTMEPSQLSRFGLTCAVLTEDHGEALLTWFRADSRVRTYPLPGLAPALMASAPGFGEKWHESSVRFDRDSSSWRTHRCLWDEALPWSSVTLPSWGMTRAGVLWEPPTSGRPISATGSGLWPTPTVCGNYNMPGSSKNAGWGLASAARLWPTPTASLADKGGRITPRKGREGGTLIEAVSARRWATPTKRDHKGGARWESRQRQGEARPASDMTLPDQVLSIDGTGQLNPQWVEWLMGWPTGWTESKPLAMARFHEWQQQHSPTYHKAGSDAA